MNYIDDDLNINKNLNNKEEELDHILVAKSNITSTVFIYYFNIY